MLVGGVLVGGVWVMEFAARIGVMLGEITGFSNKMVGNPLPSEPKERRCRRNL